MKKIRWGILSTANIGMQKVVPAMQQGDYCEIAAIASRDHQQAEQAASRLGIVKAFGSYQELLNDVDIDAIYIPLPNNLHLTWTIKALKAGKHVLCEKPIGLTLAEAKELNEVSKRYPHLKVMEAFMYRFHPQWQVTKKLVEEGRIGEVRTMQCFFSYYNTDPSNIRNKPEAGGGALMDIGCYCISQSRYIFGAEPVRVQGIMEFDPEMKTDRVTSAILDFSGRTSTFTCSTQLFPFQQVIIFGTNGRIEIEVPVNASPDTISKIRLCTAGNSEEITFDACNQYTLQGDEFSKSILNDTPVPTGLSDAVANMNVIDALKMSHTLKKWIRLDPD